MTLEEHIQKCQKLISEHPELKKAIVLFEGNTFGQEMFYADEIKKLTDKYTLNEVRIGRNRQTLGVVITGDETV